jgi:cholesterol oxidase
VSEPEHFDAVVIGSGFGGSVMAYRLADAGLRVCLLERGKRYPPGSFARSPREMSANFWDPSDGRQGLFQVWRFGGIDGLVSAGLGGGSLIYANVLLRKDERWFVRPNPAGGDDPWPVTRAELDPHYDKVEAVLAPQRYPFDHEPYSATPKTRAFKAAAEAAGLAWSLPPMAVTYGDPPEHPVPGEPIYDAGGGTTDNLHHRTRYTCRLCGECDIGCNYGSKNTLDYNYLTRAEKLGVELRDRCEVRTFAPRPGGGGYLVSYVEHRPENEGRPTGTSRLPAIVLTCDRLVLSAGTFGSTFLLLKNSGAFPGLSPQLGHYFSGNGDFLGLVHDAHETVDGERVTRVLAPSHGSVITSTVRMPDVRDGGDGPGFYLQDGGYPGLVDWLAEATNASGALHRALRFVDERIVARLTHSSRTDLDHEVERLIGDAHRSASILPLLGMGLDTPDGVMSLDGGNLALDWNARSSTDYFDRVEETMRAVARELDAELQIDPLWYLHHKVITVHPVGGCSMGHTVADGVIDSHGEVFGYPGFVVADGSVMPGPVGPNPSFTIAALSDRFADHQIEAAGQH